MLVIPRSGWRCFAVGGAVACLLLGAMRAQAAVDAAAFTAVECHRSEQLIVRLRVRNTASAADRDWLQFEFENRTAAPLRVANFGFRLDGAEAFDPATGALLRQQSLASGNMLDLFFGSTTRDGVLLDPGVTRRWQPVSDYATALLGVPPTGGWRMAARVVVFATLPGEQAIANGGPGLPFEFRWLPPDDAGLTTMRKTVVDLLQQPRLPIGSIYLASMLLALPDVGSAVGLPALLAVRARSDDRGEAWPPWQHVVLGHLDAAFATDASLVAWVRTRLANGDPRIVAELQRMPHVWDRSFLPDLLRRYEAGERAVLGLLEQRGAPHRTDAAAVRRLSAPLVAEFRIAVPTDLTQQPGGGRPGAWQAATIRDLGRTCDPAVVPLLVPWLACRDPLHGGGMALEPTCPGYCQPQRLCDVALEAIQVLLGEEPRAAFTVASGIGVIGAASDLAAAAAARDIMIETLRLRLAAK